ncbi:response regulator transcription factor [Bartonella sp. TP]|uniref:response regulator transcription factor n=1 Tax=Bartonella sp. TP TaxID=3057550 RepID=UPI0025B163A2|nr:response regulator transcription factor [Bartonella sp. TP]MDN5249008.1 response regulator transcription factor [Alphaproteobacteria bacterium]WJW80263.1 response regulator transcription factor [Bartonella sp. TP]
MIVVVGCKQEADAGYYAQFAAEGFSMDRLQLDDFSDWIEDVSDNDIASVEAFIFDHGENLTELSQKIKRRSSAPLLALLESATLQQTLELFRSGMDDVLSKPVHIQEIIARVAAIARRKNGALRTNNGVIETGAIRVFNDGRDPQINNEDFVLPRRERRILEFLVTHKGSRVNKTQLFNAVYGLFETDVEENVIESHISKLRKKLKHKLGYDIIDSKRFLGYRIKDPGELTP